MLRFQLKPLLVKAREGLYRERPVRGEVPLVGVHRGVVSMFELVIFTQCMYTR